MGTANMARPLLDTDFAVFGSHPPAPAELRLYSYTWNSEKEVYESDGGVRDIRLVSDLSAHPNTMYSPPSYHSTIVVMVDETGAAWLVKNKHHAAYNLFRRHQSGTLGMPLSTYLAMAYL
jgi:hypothetical protein